MHQFTQHRESAPYAAPRLARLGTLRDLTTVVLPVFGSLAAQEPRQWSGELTRSESYFDAPTSRS